MPDHATLKLIHYATVLLSIAGFVLRGGMMIVSPKLLRKPWMRTWPHFIDTVLLVTGVWMAVNLHLNPLYSHWLLAKIIALLAYIALGFIALRHGRTLRTRIVAFLLAIACFGYMLAVAKAKTPWPSLPTF
ncbi:SirB2 family protein [Thiosocius teredinicola]|uniref:SirB2 family protein n=1 Tax=Thiosocius teredinicola TaxID=1973002 RepID=UPI000991091A